MSAKNVRNITLGVKETGESGLFTIFSNRAWLQAFNSSPYHFMLMPIMGLTFIINALIDWHQLKKAANKNFLVLLGVGASTLSAMAANASIIGTLTADFLGVSFAAGPWLFIAAISIGIATNALLLGLNIYQAANAPENSSERSHHTQAAINNVFTMLTLTAIMATISVVLISPIGTIAAAAIASTAVALTVANLAWRLIPHDTKLSLKAFFGFKKPINEFEIQESANKVLDNQATELPKPKAVSSLFAQGYRMHEVKQILSTGDLKKATSYLNDTISQKIVQLTAKTDKKSLHKLALLKHMQLFLTHPNEAYLASKSEALVAHPQAFQSTWRVKGDVEDIYDAVSLLKTQYDIKQQNQPQATLQ